MFIRKKILWSTVALTFTLLLLFSSSLRGVLAYRQLTKSIGALSYEFQEMWSLGREVAKLRSFFRYSTISSSVDAVGIRGLNFDNRSELRDRAGFLSHLAVVRNELESHEKRIRNQMESDPLLATSAEELLLVQDIYRELEVVNELTNDFHTGVLLNSPQVENHLEEIELDTQALFGFMTERMRSFRADMRSSYHTWIALIVISSSFAFAIVGASFWFFRRSVVQPFKVLLNGSRKIARGDFEHRILLQSRDELSELADAQNKMTSLFVEIRDNLNEKVRERTREVVRSEQLASVGFLAAGVAHEINNPLASIAWSAEALESRLHEILHSVPVLETMSGPTGNAADPHHQEQITILQTYLKRIQDEAFRCKGITEKLLDFSRLGEAHNRKYTDIHETISDVVELTKHLGQYRNKKVVFEGERDIFAWVSSTELKQVVLNLLTNSLDASDDGDVVNINLLADESNFMLRVSDNGCGMTEEVMTHLFEPFFTRRRDGRGTGLGMSISYRIVQDHGGILVPSSPGPGLGSTFVLSIPLESVDLENNDSVKAA